MSWDILVFDMPPGIATVGEIPDDFQPAPIGSRSELIQKISSVVPQADFTDPSWGLIDFPDFSVEVSLGPNEVVESFAFHVRGADAAAGLVAELLSTLSLRAFDTGTGEFFTPESALESLRSWRAYRDRVVGGAGAA